MPGSRPVVKAASTFWSHAHVEAAIHIEHQVRQIAMRRQMDILYASAGCPRRKRAGSTKALCGTYGRQESADGGGMTVGKVAI